MHFTFSLENYAKILINLEQSKELARKGEFALKNKKDEITIRSSAAEYLTYVASVGDQQDSFEMRYNEESIYVMG